MSDPWFTKFFYGGRSAHGKMPWCHPETYRWLEHRVRLISLVNLLSLTSRSASRFSGDTVPSDRLIRAGANATLLIHEASMADDQIKMATVKRHSTFGQAVDVGQR